MMKGDNLQEMTGVCRGEIESVDERDVLWIDGGCSEENDLGSLEVPGLVLYSRLGPCITESLEEAPIN